jgi:hypothetical protein
MNCPDDLRAGVGVKLQNGFDISLTKFVICRQNRNAIVFRTGVVEAVAKVKASAAGAIPMRS